MEGKQRIQDGERPVADTQGHLGFADSSIDEPFMEAAPGSAALAATCVATMASDNGRRPKGVVETRVCMSLPLCFRQRKKRSPKRRNRYEKLDYDLRK